eukprot:gene17288-biopygen12360
MLPPALARAGAGGRVGASGACPGKCLPGQTYSTSSHGHGSRLRGVGEVLPVLVDPRRLRRALLIHRLALPDPITAARGGGRSPRIQPCAFNPGHSALNTQPCALNPARSTLSTQPWALNPARSTASPRSRPSSRAARGPRGCVGPADGPVDPADAWAQRMAPWTPRMRGPSGRLRGCSGWPRAQRTAPWMQRMAAGPADGSVDAADHAVDRCGAPRAGGASNHVTRGGVGRDVQPQLTVRGQAG